MNALIFIGTAMLELGAGIDIAE